MTRVLIDPPEDLHGEDDTVAIQESSHTYLDVQKETVRITDS